MDNLSIFITQDIESTFSEKVTAFAQESEGAWSFFASGGSLAPALYRKLAMSESFVSASKVMCVFLGDERIVSTESDASNTHHLRRAFASLFSKTNPPCLHPLKGIDEEAPSFDGNVSAEYFKSEGLARAYQLEIESSHKPWLIHLGLGEDGHTASLFEDSPALQEESDALYRANYDPSGRNPYARITLTPKALNMADLIIITVAGTNKAMAVKALMEENPRFPMARINPKRSVLIADYSAASLLTNG